MSVSEIDDHEYDINKVWPPISVKKKFISVPLIPVFHKEDGCTTVLDYKKEHKRCLVLQVPTNSLEYASKQPPTPTTIDFSKLDSINTYPPKKDGFIRFVCLSDTHNNHDYIPYMPPGDVFIHAGDFTLKGTRKNVKAFADFVSALPYKHKIVIAGNHDITFEKELYLKKHYNRFHKGIKQPFDCDEIRGFLINDETITYLEDEMVEVEGYNIYGSPYQPEFCDWAFNLYRGQQTLQEWQKIPSNTDILVTHGPPLGHGDTTNGGIKCGCKELLFEITDRVKPLYHVFGHVHEGFGVTTDGVTNFVNASTCDGRYRKHYLNPVIVFDLPVKSSNSNATSTTTTTTTTPTTTATNSNNDSKEEA